MLNWTYFEFIITTRRNEIRYGSLGEEMRVKTCTYLELHLLKRSSFFFIDKTVFLLVQDFRFDSLEIAYIIRSNSEARIL